MKWLVEVQDCQNRGEAQCFLDSVKTILLSLSPLERLVFEAICERRRKDTETADESAIEICQSNETADVRYGSWNRQSVIAMTF